MGRLPPQRPGLFSYTRSIRKEGPCCFLTLVVYEKNQHLNPLIQYLNVFY